MLVTKFCSPGSLSRPLLASPAGPSSIPSGYTGMEGMALWLEAAAVLRSSPVCALPQYLVIDRFLLRVAIHCVTLENPEQRCMYQNQMS